MIEKPTISAHNAMLIFDYLFQRDSPGYGKVEEVPKLIQWATDTEAKK